MHVRTYAKSQRLNVCLIAGQPESNFFKMTPPNFSAAKFFRRQIFSPPNFSAPVFYDPKIFAAF
jgi:hypothetical protein